MFRCPACGGQLDPEYDWERLKAAVDRDALARRPADAWRFLELLPLDAEPQDDLPIGGTPLIESPQLARVLGVGRVWLKCDGFSAPSLSFKDRVVAVAVNKAIELGLRTVGCPSTGNLANAVAAHAAYVGLESWILVPVDIEATKVTASAVYHPRLVRVRGTYDEINRLAERAAARFGWGMVNVNLRPFYGEGSKTLAFEIAEALGWRAPTAVVAPMAGGSLLTKVFKGFEELVRLGWVEGLPAMFGAQASGCAPIAAAVLHGQATVTPVRPDTIARSIAIGDPVDGRWAVETMRRSGGWTAIVAEEEIAPAIGELARHTGVFAETAGGVTMSAARSLAGSGRLGPDDEVVLCLTGSGLKTADLVHGVADGAATIDPELGQLEALIR